MDPTVASNPQIMAMLQALQGQSGTAGMTPNQAVPGANAQQASLGNAPLPQQSGMYGPMMTPPPMPAPPQGLY